MMQVRYLHRPCHYQTHLHARHTTASRLLPSRLGITWGVVAIAAGASGSRSSPVARDATGTQQRQQQNSLAQPQTLSAVPNAANAGSLQRSAANSAPLPSSSQQAGQEAALGTPAGSSTLTEAAPAAVAAAKQDEFETEYTTEYVTETASEQSDQAPSSPTDVKGQQPASQAAIIAGGQAAGTATAGLASRKQQQQQQQQPPATASMMTSSQLSPAVQTSVSGWVVAACLLLAARLSREEADAERQDLRALQIRQAESRVQTAELRARRRAFLEQERIRKEQEATKRLEEARKRSEEEAAAKAAREIAYRESAAKETARLWAEQQAAREEFLAAEGKLKAELARRTALEVQLREEEAVRKREREEQLRREYEEEQRRRAEEAARREEEARLQAAAAEAARQEERRRLQAARTRFALVLDGTATVQQAPIGMLTTESTQPGWQRGPQVARITVRLALQLAATFCTLPAASSTHSATTPDSSTTTQPASSSGSRSLSGSFGSRFGLPASQHVGGLGGVVGHPAVWQLPGAGLPQQQQAAYDAVTSAEEGASELSGDVSRPLLEQLWEHMGTPSPSSSKPDQSAPAPAQLMSAAELKHWRRVSVACCEVASRRAVAQVAPLADRQPLDQPFQVRLVKTALPPDHESSTSSRMTVAVAALLHDDLNTVVTQVNNILEDEQDMLAAADQLDTWAGSSRGSSALGYAPPLDLPPLALQCLTYAFLLDSATQASENANNTANRSTVTQVGESPARSDSSTASDIRAPSTDSQNTDHRGQSDGPVVGVHETGELVQQVVRLARYQMMQIAKRLPSDALLPSATCVLAALGKSHPLAKVMVELADANMSTATQLRLEARKQQAELEVAAALLRAQDPGALNPNDPASRQELVPVPERLWATRNVAGSMVRFGEPAQASEALGMLQSACKLAATHYGPTHPSCAAVLLDTRDALMSVLSRTDETDTERRQQLTSSIQDITKQLAEVVQAIGERYLEQQDVLSAVILYDSAVKVLGPVNSRSPSALVEVAKQAADLVYQLTPQQARVAISKRNARTSQLRALATEFTEELGVYSATARTTRLQQWQQGAELTPLR